MRSNQSRELQTPSSQADVLAAAALLLTLLGVLYALWYQEIQTAIQTQPKPVRTKADFDIAAEVLWTRAIPLAAATILDFLVFAPAALGPTRAWLTDALRKPDQAITHYDPVPVAVNLASLLTLALVTETVRQGARLWSHCYRDLNPRKT